MFNTISKKLISLQILIVIIIIGAFIFYINQYLSNYIHDDTEDKLSANIEQMDTTIQVYNTSLEETAKKLYKVFYSYFTELTLDENNQISVKGIKSPAIANDGIILNNDTSDVDVFSDLTGGVATIFARVGDDFLRISTSLKKEDGSRAMGTFLGKNSPAYTSIMKRKLYIGNARLFGKDYITAYAPIISHNKIIGILFIGYDFTLGLKGFKKTIHTQKIGEHGYYYAINTKSLLYDIHPSKEGKRVTSEIDKQILLQKNGMLSVKEDGERKLLVFRSFPKWNWIFVGKANLSDFETAKTVLRNNLLLATTFMVFLMIVIIGLVIKKVVTNPLQNLIQRTADLSSGNGDLTKKLTVVGSDEIAQASKGINSFIEKVRLLISDAKNLATENSSVAQELSTTTLEVGKLVENSTAIVNTVTQDAAKTKDEMGESIDEARSAKEEIIEAKKYLKEANKAILDLTEEIKISASTEIELAHKIQQLSSDTEQVKDVLQVIGDIADQTNLLALNAAIEAARAGEHGRGFAVVADEVRKLAERTQKSLFEINATINVIVQSITNSSEEMTQNSQKVEKLSATAISVEQKIAKLSTMIETSTSMADQTVSSYINTGNDIEHIISSIAQINNLSTQNTRSVEEIASAAEHLNKMTETLHSKLAEFRT